MTLTQASGTHMPNIMPRMMAMTILNSSGILIFIMIEKKSINRYQTSHND